jgi:hypothetical protein
MGYMGFIMDLVMGCVGVAENGKVLWVKYHPNGIFSTGMDG